MKVLFVVVLLALCVSGQPAVVPLIQEVQEGQVPVDPNEQQQQQQQQQQGGAGRENEPVSFFEQPQELQEQEQE